MCLMLYVATARPFAGTPPSPLQIALAEPAAARRLRATVSLPHLALVTSDGCSCAFPAVLAGAPAVVVDGPAGAGAARSLAIASLRALVELVERCLGPGEVAEVFPVQAGAEAEPARGRIEAALAAVDPERFVLVESHLHVLRA
jgi:hypothetical protein